MKDKTETAVQGLVNLDGENIAIGSMISKQRRLKKPTRSRMFSIAQSIKQSPGLVLAIRAKPKCDLWFPLPSLA